MTPELSRPQEYAMIALFDLCDEITEGKLSIRELADAIKVAVPAGSDDMLEICLAMVVNGARVAKAERVAAES